MSKIQIEKEYDFTGGDCMSHYKNVRFVENPTLEEFVNWVLTERPDEWGYIRSKWIPDKGDEEYVEYSDGKLIGVCDNYNEIKGRKISLLDLDSGWTRTDYTIEVL